MNEQPSPSKLESREQTMLREEQEMKELMVEQYYRYVSLLKGTNNFQRSIDTYARVNLYEYNGQIAVIGRITEVVMAKEKDQEFCFPVVTTTINRILFQDQDRVLSKRSFMPIIRKFMISGAKYRTKLLLPLNKVVSTCKKNKEQLFIFTHLRLLLKDEKQLCFGLSDDSFLIQLDPIYYGAVFKNIELSLTSTYSDLHLQAIYPQMDLNKGSTFVLKDIQNKIAEKLEGFVVMGILKKVIWSTMKKAVNPKEKEVTLDLVQDSFHPRFKSIGSCRIYVRFDILDEQELLRHMKEGCVYIFTVNEFFLADNVVLNFKISQWRKNFIRITSSPIRARNINDLYRDMYPSPMSDLTNHCICRNIYKFSVIKYDVKMLHVKLICQKCQGAVFRSESYEYVCRNDCGKIKGRLRLWAIVGVMDESCYSELTMQDKCAFDFFDVPEDIIPRFKEEVAKEEQELTKLGVLLYYKQTKDQFSEDQPKVFITSEQNEFLACLVEQWVFKIVEKKVVGSARINTNEHYRTFDEELKQEALTSFAKPKEYLKKAKVFVNGYLRAFQGRGRLIPYIKVESVMN